MSFAPMQQSADEWIQKHTPGYFQPLQMIARLTEELEELSRAVSHRFGEKRPAKHRVNELGLSRR